MKGLFTLLPEKLALPGFEKVENAVPVSGGDINDAYRIDYAGGSFFIKINDARAYPQMFEKEARGLQLLKAHSTFKIPEVLSTGAIGNEAFLALEHLESGKRTREFWPDFAEKLADLHRTTSSHFGLDEANYIGKLQQPNEPKSSWAEFFASQRILPKFREAQDKGYFSKSDSARVEQLLAQTGNLVPEEEPALVHGDLWGGNYMVAEDGQPVLIDPAVYYGHREMDLAMMNMFGGFGADVFQLYHDLFPLEPGWRERIEFHNLYPVLVHVNLFGDGYIMQAKSIIERYS